MLTTAPKVALHRGDVRDRPGAHGGDRMTFRAQKTTPAAKQYVAKCNRRTPTPIQAVLPGLVPTRPRDTALGRRILDAMREHGIARTLQRMHLAVGVVDRDRELEYRGNRRAA